MHVIGAQPRWRTSDDSSQKQKGFNNLVASTRALAERERFQNGSRYSLNKTYYYLCYPEV